MRWYQGWGETGERRPDVILALLVATLIILSICIVLGEVL